jgi:hypothetical protein
MKKQDLLEYKSIRPLKYPLSEAPHATVETNRTCNIRCANCYNIDREEVKRLPDIKKEIDAMMAKRNLQALTILGGEPTLHPDLIAIVAYIKGKNVRCQLLTNGIVFLSEEGDGLLDKLRAAHIDRITLHVDHGQSRVHGDIERVRAMLFDKIENWGMHFSLSITIDGPDRAVIPELAKKYSRYRYFDGILGVLARDPYAQDNTAFPSLNVEYASISKGLEIEPCAYVPSNIDEQDVRWLIYYYFINTRTQSVFGVSSAMYSLCARAYRLCTGRHPFLICISPAVARFSFLLSAVAQAILTPRKFPSFIHCIRSSSFMQAIRLHYIAIQVPPEFDEAVQAMRMCFNCPDATMRNGMVVPVCLADFMSALSAGKATPCNDNPRYDSVRKHLAIETIKPRV